MTDSNDYDDPEREVEWLNARRRQVVDYLESEGARHGGVANEPAWFVAPYVSVWPIMSVRVPGAVGWWAIAGDLPTDYLSPSGIHDPRTALRAFAKRWRAVAACMARGEPHPDIRIGTPNEWPELSDLLRRRAELLQQIADDDQEWIDEEE